MQGASTLEASALGAEPIGLTDCLNFGNPERPEIMWQLAEAIEGIVEAARALDIPVVGGNVSLYNETEERAILPTPTVAVVGLLERAHKARPMAFRQAGDSVVLLGRTLAELGGTEYLACIHGLERGLPPSLDLEAERSAQRVVREALKAEFLSSVHDLADGGLAVALAECCLGPEGLGARVSLEGSARPDVLLFSETPSRYLLSLPGECLEGLSGIAAEHGVPLREIGEVVSSELVVETEAGSLELGVEELRGRWSQGFIKNVLTRIGT